MYRKGYRKGYNREYRRGYGVYMSKGASEYRACGAGYQGSHFPLGHPYHYGKC
jgi:hypothetical protein